MKCIEPSEECLIDTSYGHLWVPSRPRCSCGLLTKDQGFEFVSIEVSKFIIYHSMHKVGKDQFLSKLLYFD